MLPLAFVTLCFLGLTVHFGRPSVMAEIPQPWNGTFVGLFGAGTFLCATAIALNLLV